MLTAKSSVCINLKLLILVFYGIEEFDFKYCEKSITLGPEDTNKMLEEIKFPLLEFTLYW